MTEAQFTQELQTHQRIIHKVCLLYCSHADDREDLFQEIVLQAWKSVSKFRGDSKFSTWLYQIALNTAISHFKKTSKSPLSFFTSEKITTISSSDEPWKDAEVEEQFLIMYKAISQLNKVDKALVTLYLEDYDYKTIGEMLGISANNVAVKMGRIKVALRESINSQN